MKACNIEFFDKDFKLLYHTNVDSAPYAEDYLNPKESKVDILLSDSSKVTTGNYIRIQNSYTEYFGIVKSVSTKTDVIATVSYSSFLSKFDQEVLFDTNLQGTDTLEGILARYIINVWGTSAVDSGNDSVETVPGLVVTLRSRSIKSWSLNLKSDITDSHYCKVASFLKTFILQAMKKYGISFRVIPDFDNKQIRVSIGTDSSINKTIEAGLPNVISKEIVIAQGTGETNKLLVYDSTLGESMAANPIIYYLHTDDTYTTQNRNRRTPVIRHVEIVSSSDKNTFAQLAQNSADDILGNVEHENYITIECLIDDSLIRPLELDFGQYVHVISNGKQYTSILTGKEIEDTVVLTFGTLRLDLTTKI